jgi:hypothetical protein
VRQSRDEPGGQHQLEGRCERGRRGTGDEQREEPENQAPTGHPGRQHRDRRRARDDTERVDGDHPAGPGERIRHRRRIGLGQQVAGDVGQQPHGDELGEPESEAAQ